MGSGSGTHDLARAGTEPMASPAPGRNPSPRGLRRRAAALVGSRTARSTLARTMEPGPLSQRELTEGWRAAVADDHLRRAYADPGFDDTGWAAITVPGHWRSTPAFADTDGPLLHRCGFDAPAPPAGRRAWLTFDGLFYQGDIWLDGGYLGDTEGYFFPHTFEVTDALRDRTTHTLAVELTCTPQHGSSAKRNITGVFQHWDCLDPEWNPGGIWRPVRLTETGPVRIASLRVLCTEAGADRAVLALQAVLDSDRARRVRLRTEVGALDHEADQPLAAGTNEVNWTVTIERPTLWWPRALGDAVLHDVRVAVLVEPGGEGDPGAGPRAVSDERRLRTGLRSVRLRRWIASVNGERLFLKGSNLGPTRMALAEATPAELQRDVDLAVETGLDLLRVHAHITRPELYDAADEAGLLLWQDMPLQWGYARGIRREAVRQARAMVDLLGHHPSVAVWCGHNEPVPMNGAVEVTTSRSATLALVARMVAEQQLPTWNRSVLDASLKRALQKADVSRPVVAHSGVAPHLPQLEGTDSHLYVGWYTGDERDLPVFARRLPRMVRFVSEFGAQAVPSGDGSAFAEPERWPDLDWRRLEARHSLQKAVFDLRVPPAGYATFGGWRDATQRYQANLVRHHVEELRRLKYRPTGGFAQFLFADGHPGVTWSVLDHERRPKLAFDALREACRPVVVVADRLPETVVGGDPLALDVHVVSDLRAAIDDARVTARLSWPGGEHTWRWRGDVGPDTCVRVGTIQAMVPDLGPDAAGDLALELELHLRGGEFVTNRYEARFA
jgi:beta-mannosidase